MGRISAVKVDPPRANDIFIWGHLLTRKRARDLKLYPRTIRICHFSCIDFIMEILIRRYGNIAINLI